MIYKMISFMISKGGKYEKINFIIVGCRYAYDDNDNRNAGCFKCGI